MSPVDYGARGVPLPRPPTGASLRFCPSRSMKEGGIWRVASDPNFENVAAGGAQPQSRAGDDGLHEGGIWRVASDPSLESVAAGGAAAAKPSTAGSSAAARPRSATEEAGARRGEWRFEVASRERTRRVRVRVASLNRDE